MATAQKKAMAIATVPTAKPSMLSKKLMAFINKTIQNTEIQEVLIS